MATAKKLPSGSWRVQLYVGKGPDGKRQYLSFTRPTKKEAEYEALQYQLHYKEVSRDATAMTFQEAAEYTRRRFSLPLTAEEIVSAWHAMARDAYANTLPLKEGGRDFLERAFTIIFGATIVIWFLQTFGLHLNVVTDSRDSILAAAAGVIAPLFSPLGFGDWRVCTALISGFMAKESVVSTLSVLFGSTENLSLLMTPLTAAAFLVFCLLYTPCVAAVSSVKRELGAKWALFVVIGQCLIAWLAAFAVRLIGSLLGLA